MLKDNYNWWTDPKNKEQVKRLSWWNHDKNKTTFPLPISIAQSGDCWVATCNNETELLLGDKLHGVAQGKTKEEAINSMFMIIRLTHEYSEECRLNYQRWVPLRFGNWKHIGGRWFTVFGINVYFRYGKNMKGGKFIPFTSLNISIHSEWATYRNWKASKKNR